MYTTPTTATRPLSPALNLRPADQRRHRRQLTALAALAAALILSLALHGLAGAQGSAYVMYSNSRSQEVLGVMVTADRTERLAQRTYDDLDSWAVEDAFDVYVGDENALTRSQARGMGVDEMKSFFVMGADDDSVGMVNVMRQGTEVYLVLYIALDEPDFDLGFLFTDRVAADGLDARKPAGFTLYDREDYGYEPAAPSRRTSPTPTPRSGSL